MRPAPIEARAATPETDASALRVIAGKYALVRCLGSGSAGAVWQAEHLIVGKQVAVKLLHPALSSDAELVARFISEARAAARVAHANIVDIYDLGIASNGSPYMVMELLGGETVADLVNERGALPEEFACEVALQMLAALAAAHRAGIVHRDLKPANVIVTHPRPDRPLVKLLDFGIAKGLIEADVANGVYGTPAYMAPEQARGAAVDHRTDIYSAGAVLYEMLCGRKPFDMSDVNEVLEAVAMSRCPPLASRRPDLPRALCEVVDRAMSPDPDARYSGADAFAAQLLRFVSASRAASLRPMLGEAAPIPLVTQRDPMITDSLLRAPRLSPPGRTPGDLTAALDELDERRRVTLTNVPTADEVAGLPQRGLAGSPAMLAAMTIIGALLGLALALY